MDEARERAKKRMETASKEQGAAPVAKMQKLEGAASAAPAAAGKAAVPAPASSDNGQASSSSVPAPEGSKTAGQQLMAPTFLCDEGMVKHVMTCTMPELKDLADKLSIENYDSMAAHVLKAAIVRVCGSADEFKYDADSKEFTISSFKKQDFQQPTAASGQSA
mmetsp:Transcript_30265/g.78481  ORF Transcript_30265/g.78481 Transcript_30265/m.78481 type:complete len:163 (-) Transcript_30265:381-869(-)